VELQALELLVEHRVLLGSMYGSDLVCSPFSGR
jgi:hypothetical protein